MHVHAEDGTRLFVAETGSGPPVVLLHGGLANHLVGLRYASPGIRVIAPDLRASGASHFAGELTWDRLADDVVAVLDALGLATATVGGVSFGSGVAVRTALRHPGRVSGLVLLTPAFAGTEVGLTTAQAAAMLAMDVAGQRTLADGPQALFPLLDALPAEMRERARPVFATYDPASVATSTGFMASGAQPFDSAKELRDIACPVLLVPGSDPTHPPEISALYRDHLRECTVVETGPLGYADAIATFARR